MEPAIGAENNLDNLCCPSYFRHRAQTVGCQRGIDFRIAGTFRPLYNPIYLDAFEK